MKLKYKRLLAITLTSVVLASAFRFLGFAFTSENYKTKHIQRHNLEEIVQIIDESGVDKDALSFALREELSFVFYYVYMFFKCLVIVCVYHIIMNKIHKC